MHNTSTLTSLHSSSCIISSSARCGCDRALGQRGYKQSFQRAQCISVYPKAISSKYIYFMHITHSRAFPHLPPLLQIGSHLPLLKTKNPKNRKLSFCREEVPTVLEVPVLFCRAWLYSPPGTPALCLCNRGAPASLACLWRRREGGCRSASGSHRRGGAWPSEEFPSTPGAPLWTRAWVRDRYERKREADGACGYKCERVKEWIQDGRKSRKARERTRQKEIRAS